MELLNFYFNDGTVHSIEVDSIPLECSVTAIKKGSGGNINIVVYYEESELESLFIKPFYNGYVQFGHVDKVEWKKGDILLDSIEGVDLESYWDISTTERNGSKLFRESLTVGGMV